MQSVFNYSVSMFGEFTISYKNKKVFDLSNRSKKPWNLLAYLLVYRNRSIPQDELIKLLWSDDTSDNPVGALKVLLHRVRKSLEPIRVADVDDFIKIKKGNYFINPEISFTIDTDVFEEISNSANDTQKPITERLNLYYKALMLYTGSFLSGNNEAWVIPMAAYYHNIFINDVYSAIDLLNCVNNYSELIKLCRKAIAIEKYDEKLYYNLINALYKSGMQNDALNEYCHVTDIFYKEFGVTPSDSLKALYKTIISTTKRPETDISVIKDALREKGTASGAFLCEYEFFKDIYQLEARACSRNGDSVFLCLITMESSDIDETIQQKTLNKAIDDLTCAIRENLRRGDIFSRYSVAQFIFLLPSTSFEAVDSIMKRIFSSFYRKYVKKDILLQYKTQPVEPAFS